MTDHALDTLLAPVEEEPPTGPDLEYDGDFLALERSATPKAERVMGDDVKAAEEPDWGTVVEQATALLGRSKDLRVAVHLANAWLQTSGIPGWAAGMALVHGLLEAFWDEVHPQLDAEDDNDPTARVNAVAAIASLEGALGRFHTTPFVQSPRLGRFCLRDLRIANGDAKPPANQAEGDDAPASLTEIEACCMDCDEEQLAAMLVALDQVLEHVRGIDAIFNEQVGTAGPDLKPLLVDAGEIRKFLGAQQAQRNPEAAGAEAGDGEAGDADAEVATKAANGRINGPQDVMHRIDDICNYYARAEPSSPVPLLLRRAQRLVGLSFPDLMRDLAPGGVSELQVITGPSDDA